VTVPAQGQPTLNALSNQTPQKVLSSLQSEAQGLLPKGRKASSMARLRSLPSFPKAIGCGPPYVSCKSFCTTRTDDMSGMMPEDSVYGSWPASGEIDIMESRGNDVYYNFSGVPRGRDVYSSSLHWGKFVSPRRANHLNVQRPNTQFGCLQNVRCRSSHPANGLYSGLSCLWHGMDRRLHLYIFRLAIIPDVFLAVQ